MQQEVHCRTVNPLIVNTNGRVKNQPFRRNFGLNFDVG